MLPVSVNVFLCIDNVSSEYREEKSLSEARSAEASLPGYRVYSVCIDCVRGVCVYILEKHMCFYMSIRIYSVYTCCMFYV